MRLHSPLALRMCQGIHGTGSRDQNVFVENTYGNGPTSHVLLVRSIRR